MDDHSNTVAMNTTLPKAIETLFPPLLKLVRTKKRGGLIKARLAGSQLAESEVLLFLDSHCEVLPGWLEPLLQRIKDDYRNVALPIHDSILHDDFSLSPMTEVLYKGTFDWALLFIWQAITDDDRKTQKLKTDAVKSPTMAGGLFAISKKWFEQLGTYDPGFEVWGSENLELSFKIWMCGGRLEILPCSHVGHVFRNAVPYSANANNYLLRNTKRLAEVWLDDYKDIVYSNLPYLHSLDTGDLRERKALREKLNCHSFDWYMKNIHPEKRLPILKVKAKNGLIASNKQCFDSMQSNFGTPKLFACHFTSTQIFQLTIHDQIRFHIDSCLGVNIQELTVSLQYCEDENIAQKWIHTGPNEPIQSQLDQTFCLAFQNDNVFVAKCDANDANQHWLFKVYVYGDV